MSINFELFRSFVSVYKNKSVSAAANERFMTQPAISQHLQILESVVGEPLFIREPRKMIPTDKAKSLYAQVIANVESLETISSQIGEDMINSPSISIGSPREYFSSVFIENLKKLDLNFTVAFGETDFLLGQLYDDTVDVFISTKMIYNSNLELVKLCTENFIFVTSEEALAGTEDLEQWFNKQRWISYGPELPIIRRYWKDVFHKRPSIIVDILIPDLMTILSAVQAGVGVSILPDYLVAQSILEKKVFSPFPDLTCKNELFLCFKKSKRSKIALQKILATIE